MPSYGPPRSSRARLALAVAATLGAWGVPASAQVERPSVVSLEWRAPEGCPTQKELQAQVEAMLEGEKPSAHVVRASAERLGEERWVVTIALEGMYGTGTRVVEADSCKATADAAALSIALSIAPPRPAPRDASPRSPKPPSPSEFAVQGSVVGNVSVLPALGLGGEIGAAWRPRGLRIEGYGQGWAVQTADAPTVAGAGGRFRLWVVGVRACRLWTIRWFEAGPCAGGEGDYLNGEGYASGSSQSSDGSATWFSAHSGLLVAARAHRSVSLRATVDGVLPFSRPGFVVQSAAGESLPIHRPSTVGARASLGAELFF